MRISDILLESIVDGEGIRCAIFTQGCAHHCPQCHNPSTHDFSGGKEKSVDELVTLCKANPFLDGITLTGGDPFYQIPEVTLFCQKIKQETTFTIWAYTGFTFETLIDMAKKDATLHTLLSLLDVLVDGPFIAACRDLSLPYTGSRNQRVIHMKQTLASNKIVLFAK